METTGSAAGRVLVLAGGLSHERDVSLRSGRRVAEALRSTGMEVEERDVDAALLPALLADRPVCVVPMLHGETGEDGAIREVLELLDVPYVGARPEACRVAFDKPVAKTLAARAGIRTPESVCLPHETFRELGAASVMELLVAQLGLPLMVKPTRSGSALGCSVVHTAAELPSAMVNAYAYGPVALLERFIVGDEVAVPVVDDGSGPRALPAVGDPAGWRRLRLHGSLHRRQHPVRGAGRAVRRAHRRGGPRCARRTCAPSDCVTCHVPT